jgi:hypothetical protein
VTCTCVGVLVRCRVSAAVVTLCMWYLHNAHRVSSLSTAFDGHEARLAGQAYARACVLDDMRGFDVKVLSSQSRLTSSLELLKTAAVDGTRDAWKTITQDLMHFRAIRGAIEACAAFSDAEKPALGEQAVALCVPRRVCEHMSMSCSVCFVRSFARRVVLTTVTRVTVGTVMQSRSWRGVSHRCASGSATSCPTC